jgi:hypothetical protein
METAVECTMDGMPSLVVGTLHVHSYPSCVHLRNTKVNSCSILGLLGTYETHLELAR